MTSQKKPVILLRSNKTGAPVLDEKATLAQLHNLFEARVKTPSPNEGTSSSTITATSSRTSSPKYTPITSPSPTPTASNTPSFGPSLTSSRLLNDPLVHPINTKSESGGKHTATLVNLANAKSEPSNGGTAIIDIRPGVAHAVEGRNSQEVERCCRLCNMKTPLPKQSFIDHIMGKRHRVAEYKQKLTKEQKEDKDARTLYVRGFDFRTLPEEICGLYWDFGMIDFQASPKHVFVVFSTRKEVMTALASKVFTTNGKQLITALRSARNHVTDKDAEKPVEFFLSPVVKNLLSVVPQSEKQVLECMERLLNDVQLRPDEYENRQFVRDRVEHFLRLEFPNATCHVFGSSANNLGFREADIDLYAALGYDPYDTPRAADGEAAAAKLTHYLAKHLRRQNWASNVSAIPKARVPIVKFQQNGIAVDLSFRNAMPIQNTALIRLYTLVHPVVRPYMMMVRFWAKMQQLAGGGKPDTLLTNYALTMLMAFVVMVDRNILPPLAELRRQPYRQVIINGWNCGFGEDTRRYSNKEHDCSVLQLVLEFFEHYASLNAAEWVICPLVGQLISKKDIASKSRNRLPSDMEDYVNALGNLQHETPLCVQDPFDLTHNVSRGLRKIPLERFQLLCKKSAQILKKVMRLELPLVTLFQHIELTDDMYDEVDSAASSEARTSPDTRQDGAAISHDVIVVDDDDADESQEIEILEEIRKVFQGYENGVSKSNGVLSVADGKGIKRSSSDGQIITTSLINRLVATDKERTMTAAELQLCSNLTHDNPFTYILTVPTGCDLDLESGDLTDTSGQETNEDTVHEVGLKILEFMFANVYAAEVTRIDISDETSAKKSRNNEVYNSGSSSKCIAKLSISYRYEVREGKVSLRLMNSKLGGESVSPFSFERKLTHLQLEDIARGSNKYGRTREPFFATFYVCTSISKPGELVLLANTLNRSKADRDFLTHFLSSFRLLTNFCLKKTSVHLNWMKKKGKPKNLM